jgi:bacterioferritin-associated ferredoxin
MLVASIFLLSQGLRLTIILVDGKDNADGGNMYVCICNRYRDAEIDQIARSGVRCARAAYSSLGNGPRCGRCLSLAQNLIDRIHQGAEQHRECSACAADEQPRDAGSPAAARRADSRNETRRRERRLSPFAEAVSAGPENGWARASLACDD